MGLGLFFCKEFANLNNGDESIDSTKIRKQQLLSLYLCSIIL
jgi:hypothetical protein